MAKIPLPKAAQALQVWPVFWRTLAATGVIYGVQIYFAIACILGLAILAGIDDSFVLSALDVVTFGTASGAGGALLILGMVGSMLCGLLTFIVSAGIFNLSNIQSFQGFSIVILALCSAILLLPVANFLPVMWLWNLYVAISNI